MVKVNREYCRICEGHRQFINSECVDCRERERREEMAAWKAKTTDEKLLDIHKRLLNLENNKPISY